MREKKMSVSTNCIPLPNAYITEGNIEIGDNNKTITKKWTTTKCENKNIKVMTIYPNADDCAYTIILEYVGRSDDGNIISGTYHTCALYRDPKGWKLTNDTVETCLLLHSYYVNFELRKYEEPATSSDSIQFHSTKDETKSLDIICSSDFIGQFAATIRLTYV